LVKGRKRQDIRLECGRDILISATRYGQLMVLHSRTMMISAASA